MKTYSSSHSMVYSSIPDIYPINLEWKAFKNKVTSILLSILALSAIFILFILKSSNPYYIIHSNTFANIDTIAPKYNNSAIVSTNLSNSLPIQDQVFSDNTTIIEKTKTSTINMSISQDKKETFKLAPSQEMSVDAKCNLFEGKWIRDYRGPMYTNTTCKTLPDLRNCGKYGKNQDYINWRWRPNGCELPRFDPWSFLRIVKGKKLMFIGDSLARNMMESTLCLLSQAEVPTDIYKDEKDKHRTFYFPNHNFTLMVIWTEFLVDGHEIIKNGTPSNTFSINMDKMHPRWAKILPELNYAVLNNGNWFTRITYIHKGGKLIGCVHCPPQENIPDISVASALRMVLRAALKYTSKCEKCEDLLMVMRTYSMSHFENGSWFSGGYCNRTVPLEYGDDEMYRKGQSWELWKVQMEEFERAKKGKKRRFELMDVTKAMVVRADAHPGKHWIAKQTSDCLHWCMPGPIDMWSELLLQIIKRRSL